MHYGRRTLVGISQAPFVALEHHARTIGATEWRAGIGSRTPRRRAALTRAHGPPSSYGSSRSHKTRSQSVDRSSLHSFGPAWMKPLDGRILPDRWHPSVEDRGVYERLHNELGCDAWLVGRVTGQEFASREAPYPSKGVTPTP